MTRKILIGIVLAGLIGFLAWSAYAFFSPNNITNGVACTEEAMLCPDGSAVGRTGPKCEFAPCPAVTSTATSTATSTRQGVQGVVLLGPTCPVERIPPDPQCADKRYGTLIAIFRVTDPVHAVVLTRSDAQGLFKASLPPGEYSIGAGESNLPRCAHVNVTVRAGVYASTTIFCDTGIR